MQDSSRRNDTRGTVGAPCADDAAMDRDAHGAPELIAQFPSLARIGRVSFGAFPTPVERVTLARVRGPLWVKRDDLNARGLSGAVSCAAGNKLRALEYLLAGVMTGDTVLALGGEGSTHVLATIVLAQRLGARVRAIRWPHEMNETARRVERRARKCRGRPVPCARLRRAGSRRGGCGPRRRRAGFRPAARRRSACWGR
jgi:hypothetical protein